MQVYKTYNDAASYAGKKMTHRFWQDRLQDMLRCACERASRDGSTPIADHLIKVDRVAAEWPRKGSVYVTRDDGIRLRLWMERRNFKVEAI